MEFSQIIEEAQTQGPQTVTRNGRSAVVVVSVDDWERKTNRNGTLVDFFAASPLRVSGVEIERLKGASMRRVGLQWVVGAIAIFVAASVKADAQPYPATVGADAHTAIAPAPGQLGQAPATYMLPPTLTVDLTSSAEPGVWAAWSPVVVAIVAAGAAVSAAVITASRAAASQGQLQRERLGHEARQAEASQNVAITTEDRRLEQAREELRQHTQLSGLEIEQAARKMLQEKKVEEAKVLDMFFDRLVSTDERVQELALFAISAFVDASVIERIASGSQLVSRGNLSKLAASGSGAASETAQTVLNRGWGDARASMVTIQSDTSDAKAAGFFVTESIIAAPLLVEPGAELTVEIRELRVRAKGRCLRVSEEWRLMLVKLSSDVKGIAVTLLSKQQHVGTSLTVAQQTEDGHLFVRSGKVTAVSVAMEVFDHISRHMVRLDGLIETDIPAKSGFGGSPLFDTSHLVAGILVAGSTNGITGEPVTSYAAPASAIASLLASSEIKVGPGDVRVRIGGRILNP